MRVVETRLPGVLLIEPDVFGDERGFFTESFQLERYREVGIDLPFVQDNHSRSPRGVLRGLHFQRLQPQGKLVRAGRGRVFDVAVDIDPSSETFGEWTGHELNDENHHQLWVPPGFAHGFCVLSDVADVHYKATDYYAPDDEGGLRWNCPEVGIEWPVESPVLSPRDADYPGLEALSAVDPRIEKA